MKKIEELSEQEILNLTDVDIHRFIKLRMAEEGIRIMTRPVEPKYTPMPAPSNPGYRVDGYSYVFSDKSAAERVSAAIKKEQKYLNYEDYPGSNYDLRYLRKIDPETSVADVNSKMYQERMAAENFTKASQENKQKKEEYSNLLDEYNTEEGKADAIREEVFEVVNRIRAKYERLDGLCARFTEYLDLAEGNSEVAMRFLRKAYTVTPEDETYVLEHMGIGVGK